MNNSGENISISIVLSHSLPTGVELYVYVADAYRKRALEFSTAANTIQVTNPDWKHFAIVLTPALSVSMIDTYSMELKLRNTDGSYVNIGKNEVVFNVRYSYAGHRMVTPSDVLPVYSNTDPRPSSSAVPQSAEVTVASSAFVVNSDGSNTLTANVQFGVYDYSGLANKPQINGVELLGNKTASALGLAAPKIVETSLPEPTNNVRVLLKNHIYALSSPLAGAYTIALEDGATYADDVELIFTTGATPPTISWQGIRWPDTMEEGLALEADKEYELSFRMGKGAVLSYNPVAQ